MSNPEYMRSLPLNERFEDIFGSANEGCEGTQHAENKLVNSARKISRNEQTSGVTRILGPRESILQFGIHYLSLAGNGQR